MFPLVLVSLLLVCHVAHGIEGGSNAQVGDFPYMVSVEHDGLLGWGHVCGGTVLNETFVLTGAQCISGSKEAKIRVYAGEVHIGSDDGVEQERFASELIEHEFYDKDTNTNDVALIRLSEPLDLSSGTVVAVPLPDAGESLDPATDCVVIGWGSGGTFSRSLQSANLPSISDADCRTYYEFTSVGDSMLCALQSGGGAGPCEGDTGGPLVCNGKQYGIYSWADGCAEDALPSVYTEISYYREWIDSHAV